MSRITTINSLEKAYKVAGQQVTAQNLLNGRMYLKSTGFTKVNLTEEFRSEIIELIVEGLGGQSKAKQEVRTALKFRAPQHWGLERFLLSGYNKSYKLSYCAGQNQPYECSAIRKYLRSL